MNTPVEVMFFANGNTAVFDEKGEQIPKLQRSWLVMFIEMLEKQGFDPTGIIFNTPDARVAHPFIKKEDGSWGWEFEKERF